MSFYVEDIYEVYPSYDKCCNCGSDDTCASAGPDLYCGPCWDEYQAGKKARKAVRALAGAAAKEGNKS